MGAVLLVRHGQASFGAADYDVLSVAGLTQAEVVGAALAARGVSPDLVAAGTLRRQQETAKAAIEAAGWRNGVQTDPAWDEFDHEQVLEAFPGLPASQDLQDPRVYQFWFERAQARWACGDHDDDYTEPFGVFTTRVENTVGHMRDELSPGGTAVVFTSGGTIAWLAATLLGAGSEQWLRLNRVAINTGITTITFGRGGTTLVGFNDHAHLSRRLLTYR